MTDARLRALFPDPVDLARIERAAHPKEGFIRQCAGVLHLDGHGGAGSAGAGAAVGYFVPGRIEVLGKHTDYCGGRSLLCAVDRGFTIVARRRDDDVIRIIDALQGEHCTFSLSGEWPAAGGHWSNYPITVARRVRANFGDQPLAGADIVFASDLPPAAGLSSSSAFIVGVFLALGSLNRLQVAPRFTESIQTLEDFAHYCGCIENGSGFGGLSGITGVGTSGGSQDHTAILCCKADTLSRYGFAPVRHERDVPFPADLAMVVLNSGVVAEKTGAVMQRYNAVSQRARALVEIWNSATGQAQPTLAAIIRSDPAAADRLRRLVDEAPAGAFAPAALRSRLDQFQTESESIIPQAASALAAGDRATFAALVRQSTRNTIEQLDNQVPQTIALTEAALAAGALAASPFGAGFGGSVWAIVPRSDLPGFAETLQATAAGVFPVRLGDGVHAIA